MPISGFPYYLRRVGGIWFLRIGRWQFSFCACRDHRLVWSSPLLDEVMLLEDITLRQIEECIK